MYVPMTRIMANRAKKVNFSEEIEVIVGEAEATKNWRIDPSEIKKKLLDLNAKERLSTHKHDHRSYGNKQSTEKNC